MELDFAKMQGTGNDFIMVNGLETRLDNYSKRAIELCDRHFGIGADGLIIILPPEQEQHDYRMRIFNVDGSEAEMCGNGIRCFSHYLYSRGLTGKRSLKIETLAGIIKPEITETGEQLSRIRVDMGQPDFCPSAVPVALEDREEAVDFVEDYTLKIEEHSVDINAVAVGNPHAVIFTDRVEEVPLTFLGPRLEKHPFFPEKTNVEFIEIEDRSSIRMRVWERGAGLTLACGTGACASVVIGIKKGYLNNRVTVYLPGGDLDIEWHGDNIFMTGPAETVFTGNIII